MIRLKLQEFEDQLVKIFTTNNYEILDYYQYDQKSGYLMTETHGVELHDSEVNQVQLVNDFVPLHYREKSNTPKKKSTRMH